MGAYVNPPTTTKEAWLAKAQTDGIVESITLDEFKKLEFESLKRQSKFGLVLLDNGAFTALLVCNSKHELRYMHDMLPKEKRRFFCFTGIIADINEVSA